MTVISTAKDSPYSELVCISGTNGFSILSTDTELIGTPSGCYSDTADEDSGIEWKLIPRPDGDPRSFLERPIRTQPVALQSSQFLTPKLDADGYSEWCSRYMTFTDSNPSTYHVVSTLSEELKQAGFEQRPEQEPLCLSDKGGAYFVTRGGKSLVTFLIGAKWTPSKGLGAVASHADALTAKLKPSSLKADVHGYSLLGVAPYSGSLGSLWLDRDLGIAGSVAVRHSDGKVLSRLVSSGRHAICRIPSLAPHFGAHSVPPYNKETQMVPVMGYGTTTEATAEEKSASLYGRHSIALLRYVAELAHCSVNDLLQLDLDLYDVQAASRGGLSHEFLYAPRIDDRLCSFSALQALIQVKNDIDFENWDGLTVVLLADNEEIGSATRTGAKGKFLNSVVERTLHDRNFCSADAWLTYANSVILSADVTHALNPNFTDDYLENHFPLPNIGLTIKLDANGHTMTDLTGVVLMEKIAKKNGITLQRFHIRNDHPSGGTIGPMLATDTGSRVIDVGLAQLSMHSIRASCGYKEVGIGVESFAAFFKDWRREYDTIEYL